MPKHSLSTIPNNPLEALSTTEKAVLRAVQSGLTSAQIADARACSIRTVEKHRSNIIGKLGLEGKSNALIQWTLMNQQNLKSY